jgi:hypothetical protein
MATMTEQVSKLLDFSQKLDITLLENIVGCMYTGTGDQVSFRMFNITLVAYTQTFLNISNNYL